MQKKVRSVFLWNSLLKAKHRQVEHGVFVYELNTRYLIVSCAAFFVRKNSNRFTFCCITCQQEFIQIINALKLPKKCCCFALFSFNILLLPASHIRHDKRRTTQLNIKGEMCNPLGFQNALHWQIIYHLHTMHSWNTTSVPAE